MDAELNTVFKKTFSSIFTKSFSRNRTILFVALGANIIRFKLRIMFRFPCGPLLPERSGLWLGEGGAGGRRGRGWASPLGGAQDCGGRPLGGRGQQIYSGMNTGHQKEGAGWGSPLGGAQDCGGRPLGGRGQQIYSGMNTGHQKEGAGWGSPLGGAQDCGGHKLGQQILM